MNTSHAYRLDGVEVLCRESLKRGNISKQNIGGTTGSPVRDVVEDCRQAASDPASISVSFHLYPRRLGVIAQTRNQPVPQGCWRCKYDIDSALLVSSCTSKKFKLLTVIAHELYTATHTQQRVPTCYWPVVAKSPNWAIAS